MAVDLRLISMKDGGRFAMSWLAGTNPKSLRSNLNRAQMYAVDVPEVCENMMETMKTKENRLSFRILFKLCFGTIHIFAEQVQHLYNVTLNFVCFNKFVLKQHSRKRLGSTVTNIGNKRRRLASSDSLDITNLLLESETFNDYSEEQFEFTNVETCCKKTQNTSTCIQIKQITIRQISWDNPLPEEEEGFGAATQDDVMTLLSELSGTNAAKDDTSVPNAKHRKRKSSVSHELTDCSPLKRSNGVVTESIDDIRCAPIIHNDTMSEFSIHCNNCPLMEVEKNVPDYNGNQMTQEELISILGGVPSQCPPADDQILMSQAVADVNLPETIPITPINENEAQRSVSNKNKKMKQELKRRPSHLIIDKVIKLSKSDMEACHENIWQNCHDNYIKEHVVRIKKRQENLIARTPSQRFQNTNLLNRFKNNFKSRLKQKEHINRELLLQEILGDEWETYKNDFKLKYTEGCKDESKKLCECPKVEHRIEEIQIFPKNMDEYNDCFRPNEYHEKNEFKKDVISLKCSLYEIDPYTISFDFPVEAGIQRSKWGKEGILMKLLSAWISKDPNINMNTLIVGASRINAALAFHTLLDLAGLQYIEIVKDETNAIASINMGPEMIRKINEKLA